MELTKEDIVAMKQADRVCFRLTKNEAYPKASASHGQITLIQEGDDASVFSRGERKREIECDGYLPGTASHAFAMFYASPRNHGAWGAVQQLARAGDTLVLTARENGNQYVRAAEIPAGKMDTHDQGYSSIHADEMCITIRRGDKTIIHELVLYHCTCPNNSARLIQ